MLFRPLTKLRVVTAVKNILDPAERMRVDKSGFPDAVVLVQISEAEEDQEMAAAAASTSKKSKAGGASSSSTSSAASAVLMAEADDSDDKPVPKMAKTAAAKSPPAKKATPVNPTSSLPAAAKEAKTGASSTHLTEASPMGTAMPYVREDFALDDVSLELFRCTFSFRMSCPFAPLRVALVLVRQGRGGARGRADDQVHQQDGF